MNAPHPLLAVLDVVALSRLQFALTIMFHYIFPPLTIGLGAVLVWLGFRGVTTGDPAFRQAHEFWTKIFAINFAIGVATGIVMEFQFGTNWAVYSEFVGDVFGSALAAEGIFAFFLESGFLAVLVFGRRRVGPRMHFASTVMVFLGKLVQRRLDHRGQQLAADAGRQPRRAGRAGRLALGRRRPSGPARRGRRLLAGRVPPHQHGPARPHVDRRVQRRRRAGLQHRGLVPAPRPLHRLRPAEPERLAGRADATVVPSRPGLRAT